MSRSVAETRDRSSVKVFHPQGRIKNVLGEEVPLFAIEKSQARKWVDQGLAEWVNRAKGVRLKKFDANIAAHGISAIPAGGRGAKMGTMERFAAGEESAEAIIAAWKPKFRLINESASVPSPA